MATTWMAMPPMMMRVTDHRSETPRSSHAAAANSIHATTMSGRVCSGSGSTLGRMTRYSRPQIITRAVMIAPTRSFALIPLSCHRGPDEGRVCAER